jgi:hypothetical protein
LRKGSLVSLEGAGPRGSQLSSDLSSSASTLSRQVWRRDDKTERSAGHIGIFLFKRTVR